MKRPLVILLVIAGVIALAAGAYGAYNILRAPSEQVTQTRPVVTQGENEEPRKLASGEFNYIDALHNAKGQAVIYDTTQGPVLALENFSSSVGPDLHVYLSQNGGLTKLNSPIGEFVSLGKLQSTKGAQTYNLPATYRDYKSVTIWCRAFQVNFSSAQLTYLN